MEFTGGKKYGGSLVAAVAGGNAMACPGGARPYRHQSCKRVTRNSAELGPSSTRLTIDGWPLSNWNDLAVNGSYIRDNHCTEP